MSEKKNVIPVLNIDIENTSIEDLLPNLKKGIVFTPNVDHLVLLQKDFDFYCAYKSADRILLDSQVLFLMLKALGKSFKAKISGSDLFPAYCEYHRNDPNVKIFVLGGMDNVAKNVQSIINTKYGNQIIVGAHSPSFGFEQNKAEVLEIINIINRSGANVLIVGLGAPKQEKWVDKYKDEFDHISLFMCVGATFDFISGKEKRSPRILQKIGLEWAFRMMHNPGRLLYRYLIRDTKIFYYLFLEVIRLYKDPFSGKQ